MNFYSNCPQCQGEEEFVTEPVCAPGLFCSFGPSSVANDDPCPRGYQRNRFGQCVRGIIGR